MIILIDSKKGENISVIDISQISVIANYIIIVTATSNVHSNSLAKYVVNFFNELPKKQLFTKNPAYNNPWILIDATDIIVHIFQRESREYYNLEKIYFKGKLLNLQLNNWK